MMRTALPENIEGMLIGLTPNSVARAAEVAATARPKPTSSPNKTHVKADRSTWTTICAGLAPKAMRIPSSLVSVATGIGNYSIGADSREQERTSTE